MGFTPLQNGRGWFRWAEFGTLSKPLRCMIRKEEYAITDNNGMGYNMNLVPQGYANGGYDGGMFGGNWMWFLLVWMAMFGWGNCGMFGGGNRGGGYVGNEVQRGFDQQAIMTGISGVQKAEQT